MLAYVHRHLSGFLPCKALARARLPEGTPAPAPTSMWPELLVRLTADRGPYKRGEVLRVPRGEVVRRPLLRSRQSPGRLYGYTLPPEAIAQLPLED